MQSSHAAKASPQNNVFGRDGEGRISEISGRTIAGIECLRHGTRGLWSAGFPGLPLVVNAPGSGGNKSGSITKAEFV